MKSRYVDETCRVQFAPEHVAQGFVTQEFGVGLGQHCPSIRFAATREPSAITRLPVIRPAEQLQDERCKSVSRSISDRNTCCRVTSGLADNAEFRTALRRAFHVFS